MTQVKISGPHAPGRNAYRSTRTYESTGYSSITHAQQGIDRGAITRPGVYTIETHGEVALVEVEQPTVLRVKER